MLTRRNLLKALPVAALPKPQREMTQEEMDRVEDIAWRSKSTRDHAAIIAAGADEEGVVAFADRVDFLISLIRR